MGAMSNDDTMYANLCFYKIWSRLSKELGIFTNHYTKL